MKDSTQEELLQHSTSVGIFLEVEDSSTTRFIFWSYCVLYFLVPVFECALMILALKYIALLSLSWTAFCFAFPALFAVATLIAYIPSTILLYSTQYLPKKENDAFAKCCFFTLLTFEWIGLAFFSAQIKVEIAKTQVMAPNQVSWSEYLVQHLIGFGSFTLVAGFTSIINFATPISACVILLVKPLAHLICLLPIPGFVMPSNLTLVLAVLLIHCVYTLYMNIFVRDAWRICAELFSVHPCEDNKYQFYVRDYMEKSKLKLQNIAPQLKIDTNKSMENIQRSILLATHPDKTVRLSQDEQARRKDMFLKLNTVIEGRKKVSESKITAATGYVEELAVQMKMSEKLLLEPNKPLHRPYLFKMVRPKYSLEVIDVENIDSRDTDVKTPTFGYPGSNA